MLCPDPKKRLTLAQISEHEWLKEVPSKTNVKDVIPFHPKNEEDIDEDIIEEMKEKGFDPETLVKNILKENYNQIAATYALLAQKKNKDIQKGIAPIAKPRKNSDSRAVQSQKDFTKLEELELASLMKRMEVKKARPRASTVTTKIMEEPPKHSRQNSDKLQSISEISPVMDRAAPSSKPNRPMSASVSLAPAVIPPPVTTSSQKSLPKTTPGLPTISFAELPKPEKDNAKHPALARIMKTQLARPRSKTVSNTPMPDVAKTVGNLAVPSNASPTSSGSTTPNSSGNSFKRSASSSSGNFDNGIKAVRFAFNLSTTFQLEPEKIMEEIKKSLLINLVNFSLEGYCFHCTQQYKESTVEFELELCKVPRLSLYGIKFRRTRGDIWEYKRCCTRLIQSWDHLKSK
jgi:MAP/microtubule affinity-regulating kinase